MARRGNSVLSYLWTIDLLIKLSLLLCLFMLLSRNFALARESSNEKDSALTVVESSNEDEVNDGIVSDEPNGQVNGLDDGVPDSGEAFVPTKEWKTVKKGQKVPAGLHVRLNLQTGEKEAKLMDGEPAKEVNQWDAGENIGIINTEKKRFTRDELKQVVKDFKIKDTDSKQPQDKEDVKSKYRSYDELKKALKEMEMAVKTEAEIVTELMTTLNQSNIKSDDVKSILVDLEYYLHQIDVARLFCDLGGMATLLKFMNNTDADIRAKATHALGAAVQSNGKVQVEAIEHGVLQQLLRILSVDQSPAVRKKSLFALSGLLRQFPFAQKQFLSSGGLSALGDLFVSSADQSMKVKIITLLTDLVLERDLHTKHQTSDDKTQQEKTRQYLEVKMQQAMQDNGWCTLLTTLLEELTEHDDVEKTLTAMSVVKDVCKKEFTSSRPKLKALSNYYNNLAKEDADDPDSYFISIFTAVETLLKQIPFSREDL